VSVEVSAARAALGLGPRPTWEEVRAAYRALIRDAHPDRAGGSTGRAATLNAAYATLLRARRDGALPEPPDQRPDPAPPAGAPIPAEVLDGDTVHLRLPPDEAFMRLLDAAHEIGHVTYLDRSCSIFEALVTVAGEGTCSLVVSLQGRADGTDAFCTLEAIEHVASPPVRHVVEALVAAL
jgi:hypothetical protein